MKLTRRGFLAGALATAAGGGATWAVLRERRMEGTLLSAFEDARGDQYVGGVSLHDKQVFGARVPMRAHGCALDPGESRRVIFFARRPGTQAFELDRESMQVRPAFSTAPGRHLAGHGVFSAAGDVLFVPEHDYEHARGLLTVRDAHNFKVLAQIATHGIDPHEVAWLPDGKTLLVANGGILTHPRTFRRKLNIATMDPSLCAIDVTTARCAGQWRLPDHLLSIRHLAVAHDGSVAAGLQYEGRIEDTPGVVALYRPTSGLRLLNAPPDEVARFRGYVASVSISDEHDLIAAACPYGNGIACWALREQRYRGFITAHEVYGLSRLADGSILASQRDGSGFEVDEIRPPSHFLHFASANPIRWDDHWLAAA